MMRKLLANEAAFDPLLLSFRVRADGIMVGMNSFLLLVCFMLTPLQNTLAAVLLVGVPTWLLSLVLLRHYAGTLTTRLFMASSFMVFTGLIIHQTGGDIEAHFSAFGLIGVLLYYRDWRTILMATVVIYLHHLILGYAQSRGVPLYVFDENHFWLLFGIHVAYFLPFVGMMGYLAIWLRREGYEGQRVIVLAQHIIQGNLTEDEGTDNLDSMADLPLIAAVHTMKDRLLELLRVMPVAAAVIRIEAETDQAVSTNHAWEKTLGKLADRTRPFGQQPIWRNSTDWGMLLQRLHQAPTGSLDKVEMTLSNAAGLPVLCEVSLVLHHGIKPMMAILTLEDISLRRKTENTMRRLAYRDMLTDLPNRASLQIALHSALADWENQGIPFAVVVIDLDGFKPINDTYGHDAGDQVLQAIGARLQHTDRLSDLASRLGGDEFAIVLRGCAAYAATGVAQRALDRMALPIWLKKQNLHVKVGASAGVAHIADSEATTEALLKNADRALYAAKAAGKGQVALFTAALMETPS